MFPPARWTTASIPLPLPRDTIPDSGSQRASPVPPPSVEGRTSRVTSCPLPESSRTSADPTNPVEPVTSTFIRSSQAARRSGTSPGDEAPLPAAASRARTAGGGGSRRTSSFRRDEDDVELHLGLAPAKVQLGGEGPVPRGRRLDVDVRRGGGGGPGGRGGGKGRAGRGGGVA